MSIQQLLLAGGGGGGGGITDLYTTANLVYMLDAGRAASYPGSGETFANAITVPADGSAQTNYDYWLGANGSVSGDEPTFSNLGPASYFSFDGSDYFNFKLAAASMPAFMKALHKSGSKFTIECWMRYPGSAGSNINPLFDSGTSDQSGTDMSRGVIYLDLGSVFNSGLRQVVRVKRDASGANALSIASDAVISGSVVHMLACSIDGTGGANSFFYKDGAYDQVSSADTFVGTFSSPGTSDTANNAKIGARGDALAASRFPNLARIYLMRVYNSNLSKAQLDANWNNDRARYGL